jgi:hypothetical protein
MEEEESRLSWVCDGMVKIRFLVGSERVSKAGQAWHSED